MEKTFISLTKQDVIDLVEKNFEDNNFKTIAILTEVGENQSLTFYKNLEV